ncbi:MAG TPA: glycoside hydrolase family 32 protein [Verrucomicrobiae bacterium]|nr:glycoside hydrolase family 32 protein [Verrucomicrobiae bacterium]
MRTTRRNFLRVAAASGAFASLSRRSWPASPNELQTKLAADPLRPQFHLLPAKNWMNDPNGPIFWNNAYHMFYQYNPGAAVWGDMHWAHAVSEDMIHWRHLPIALAPTSGWDDADGCFTGSAVDDHGTATILYTGVKSVAKERATLRDGHNNFREVQCLATSTDPQLRTWTKWKPPVIQPPNDPTLAGFRDPFLWRQGDDWILGVASGHFRKGGCILLYHSKDLRRWEPLHELTSGHWTEKESINPVDSGEMWECPDFFPLGKKHVLLYSAAGSVVWESGEFDPKELKFHSERRGILDHGAYYAQKTQLDAHGNRILWGWIPEKRPDPELIAAGWAGCMALPRVLTLSPEGELEMAVAPQAQSLREKPFSPSLQSQPDVSLYALFEDLRAELTWASSVYPFTLTLEDRTGLWWSAKVTADNSAATLTVNDTTIEIPRSDSSHSFHLFVDGSVAELIVDHRHAVTTRIYRKPEGPLLLVNTTLESCTGWHLRAISSDRLTT